MTINKVETHYCGVTVAELEMLLGRATRLLSEALEHGYSPDDVRQRINRVTSLCYALDNAYSYEEKAAADAAAIDSRIAVAEEAAHG